MKVRKFSEIRLGYTFRESLQNVPNGGVMVIQPKNISSDGLVTFSEREPLRTDAPLSKPLRAGDVLVVNRGRFGAAVFEREDEGSWIVPSSIVVLSVNKDWVLPEYVALYLNSANGQMLFKRHSEQTTVPFISTGNLANMDIPVPSLERQGTLIAFERTARRYAHLTNRKQELHSSLLNYELLNTEHSSKRRTK